MLYDELKEIARTNSNLISIVLFDQLREKV